VEYAFLCNAEERQIGIYAENRLLFRHAEADVVAVDAIVIRSMRVTAERGVVLTFVPLQQVCVRSVGFYHNYATSFLPAIPPGHKSNSSDAALVLSLHSKSRSCTLNPACLAFPPSSGTLQIGQTL
jgi:hypothetical protein